MPLLRCSSRFPVMALSLCLLMTLLITFTVVSSVIGKNFPDVGFVLPKFGKLYDEVKDRHFKHYDKTRKNLGVVLISREMKYDDDDEIAVQNLEVNATTPLRNSEMPPYLCRKPKQQRRKPKKARRPSSFWSDINNVERELRTFWEDLEVPISSRHPPIIPSEALLNHFERNDLRYAIAYHGGREAVADWLGAELVPGKWADAVKSCWEVKELLSTENPYGKKLSIDVPPIARHVRRALERKLKGEKMRTCKKRGLNGDGTCDLIMRCDDSDVVDNNDNVDGINSVRFQGGERWAHQSGRNPRGHWNQDVVIEELYVSLHL